MAIWQSLLEGLEEILRFFHGVTEPLFGIAAWGWAIVLLTVAVRIILLPLAVKQTNSMRAMQKLQPEMKKIQEKYKTDRSLMRTNPEKFQQQRQKQQEAMMALYKEHNVNPASGCLPLLLQMPIFFALFSVLRSDTLVPELATSGFYGIDSLQSLASSAGIAAWLLIVLMGATTFLTQRQTMAANPGQQMSQQKILLYVMPVMLMFFSINLPVGVLLYWVTTNLWTMGQQWIMFRSMERKEAVAGTGDAKPKKA